MTVLKKWEDIPSNIKNASVKEYYEKLNSMRRQLWIKKCFDLILGIVLLVILSPVFLFLSIVIKLDSTGTVFFRQKRVTQYGKEFEIIKFRTMVENAERLGTQVTVDGDMRITKVGKFLRKCRLDEIPQLFNVIKGEMSFVGTRPEVIKYVENYSEEMLATLLLPAGITSRASIEYKEEEKLLKNADNADKIYINEVLPEKMKYNLKSIEEFSFLNEIKIMFRTISAVIW